MDSTDDDFCCVGIAHLYDLLGDETLLRARMRKDLSRYFGPSFVCHRPAAALQQRHALILGGIDIWLHEGDEPSSQLHVQRACNSRSGSTCRPQDCVPLKEQVEGRQVDESGLPCLTSDGSERISNFHRVPSPRVIVIATGMSDSVE
jgi:hypothetical protein